MSALDDVEALLTRYLALPYPSIDETNISHRQEAETFRADVLRYLNETPLERLSRELDACVRAKIEKAHLGRIEKTVQPPDLRAHPYRGHVVPECNHGISYDASAVPPGAPAHEIRKKFPRLCGVCPLGCGYEGIAYASIEHYVSGDW